MKGDLFRDIVFREVIDKEFRQGRLHHPGLSRHYSFWTKGAVEIAGVGELKVYPLNGKFNKLADPSKFGGGGGVGLCVHGLWQQFSFEKKLTAETRRL
jgi:hypothetical protein